MKIFVNKFLLSGILIALIYSFTLVNDNKVLVELSGKQHGWSYIIFSHKKGQVLKKGEHYKFNIDNVCLINRSVINDSMKIQLVDSIGNNIEDRCKGLMKSGGKQDSIVYLVFYSVGKNEVHWNDTINPEDPKHLGSNSQWRRRKYLEQKGYF